MNIKTAFDKANVLARTLELRQAFAPTAEEDSTDLRHKQVIKAYQAGSWGCQRESVRVLVEAITGKPVPNVGNIVPDFIVGSMVRFKSKTVLILSIDSDGDAFFITRKLETEIGGERYISKSEPWKPEPWKPASDQQIEAFFAE